MPLFLRLFGAHKRTHQFMRELFADYAASKNKHVHVIVLYALMSRIRVVTKSGANSAKFVRGNGSTDTASANQHGALDAFAENCFGDRFRKIWIVDWRRVTSAEVFHGVAQATKKLENLGLQ